MWCFDNKLKELILEEKLHKDYSGGCGVSLPLSDLPHQVQADTYGGGGSLAVPVTAVASSYGGNNTVVSLLVT